MTDAWDLLQTLVATPSPSGGEEAVAGVLVDWLRDRGIAARLDAAGNVRATAGSQGPRVLLAGHLDCVEPFLTPRLDGDVLWSRGAVDAKASIAAYAALLADLPAEAGVRLELAALVGEESDSRGARHLLAEGVEADALVIGEPSGSHGFTVGYKGTLRVRVEVEGATAHAGHADLTPAETLVRGWQRLAELAENVALDPSPGLVTPRLIELRTELVDGRRRATGLLDIRVPAGDAEAWQDGAPHRLVEDAFGDARVAILDQMPPYLGSSRTPLAAVFRAAIRSRGGTPRTLVKSGTSDLNILAPVLGCPAVAYGPGESALDHRPDERIERSELEEGIRVLEAVVAALPGRLPARREKG